MAIEKLIHDGQVAVLYSPGFGAGWSSWSDDKEWFLFDSGLAELVLDGANEERIERYVRDSFGGGEYAGGYLGGSSDLIVEWLPVGQRFRIHEYDGSESIVLEQDEEIWTA